MYETKIGIKLEEETKDIKKICEKLVAAVNHELDKGIDNIEAKELGEVIDMIKDLYEAKEKMVKACYYKQIMEAMEESEGQGDEDDESEDMRRGYRGQPRDSMGRFMSRRSRSGRGGRRGYEEPMFYMIPEIYGHDEMEMYRDMDRDEGRMYYSGSGSPSNGTGRTGGSESSFSSQSGRGGSFGGGGNRGYAEGGRQPQEQNYGTGMGSNQRDSREGRSGQSRRSYMETKEMNKGNSQQEKQEKMKELEKYMGELSGDITEMITDASPEEKAMLKNKLQGLIQKV